MGYHSHHDGIIVLVPWEVDLKEGQTVHEWLVENRGLFEEQVTKEIRSVPQKREIIAGAMRNYDALTKSQKPDDDQAVATAV